MKKLIFLLLTAAAFGQATNPYRASDFGAWTVQSLTSVPAAGPAGVTLQSTTATANGGPQFPAVTSGTQLLILDPGNNETVTPTGVNCPMGGFQCSFTATFTKAHPGNFSVTSGTYGLQEAINYGMGKGGATVQVTSDWPGTTSMISNAAGSTSVSIQDERNGLTIYSWNGVAYFVQGTGVGVGTTYKLPRYVNGPGGQVGDSAIAENAGQTQVTINESVKINGLQPYNMGILDDGANTNNCSGMNTSSVGYYAFCGFSGGPLQLWYNGSNSFGNVLTSNLSGAANGLATLNASAKVPTTQLPAAFGAFADTYAGATADVKLNACLSASVNSTCDARALNGAQTAAATIVIPAGVTLRLGSILLTCTITNGTPCITGANNASLVGPAGKVAQVIAGPSSNMSALVTNAVKDGTQNTFNISGIDFVGNATATLPQVVDLQAIYDPSYFVFNTVECFPSIGVHFRSAANVGAGPLHFEGNTVNGTAGCVTPNNRPVVIENVSLGGMPNFSWIGGGLEHPGNGQAIMELNGNGNTNTSNSADICVPYFENAGAGANAIKIRDFSNVTVCSFSTGGPVFTDVVNISQSGAGLTNNIRLLGIAYNQAPTSGNTYNNTITGETNTQLHASYFYGGYGLNIENPLSTPNFYSHNLCTGASSTFCVNRENVHGFWSGNVWQLTTEAAGTGSTARSMRFETGGAGNLILGTAATDYWYVNGSGGAFDAITDAAIDIGEVTHRPRNGLFSGTLTGNHATPTNCLLGGATGTVSPAACVAASSGVIAIPAATTTYTVNTTALGANSHIFLQQIADNSGISTATCNATATNPIQTARVAATSFTFTLTSNAAVTCYQYWIVD